MHVHIDALSVLHGWLGIIIFGFFWRTLSVRWSENSVGKAMAYIY